ncbi:eCIS core domain-containing protein [Kutzneria sp. CA-103260]|uniref:eCIS core domain-containing protein n=1 Tax=Kutzneria sp. CA-103260 TaxID=2802641 RepID=UPI001BA96FD6|nr:DUF4157 domain-containing protein [Kutzneria sp. CA-103260]QUQ62538.1 hypothetical protein JJ691_02500 [Kutzneria sp. CA-103260]
MTGFTAERRPAAAEPPHLVDTAPQAVGDAVRRAGEPLAESVRADLEPRFGRDFSRVRVHTDRSADAAARSVGAAAYTVGNHIAFRSGRYLPQSSAGRRLLAHELAHVTQQHSPTVPAELTIKPTGHPDERAADAAASAVLAGHPARLRASAAPVMVDRAPEFSEPQGVQPSLTWGPEYMGSEKRAYPRVLAPLAPSSDTKGTRIGVASAVNPSLLRRPDLSATFVRPLNAGEHLLVGPVSNGFRPVVAAVGGALVGYVGADDVSFPARSNHVTAAQLDEIDPLWRRTAKGTVARGGKSAEEVTAAETGVQQNVIDYLDRLNEALELLRIDTIEATANYLANALVETGEFRAFTESQDPSDYYQNDPTQVRTPGYVRTYFDTRAYPVGNPNRATINPDGNWSFRGRGPLQVTHIGNYIQSIAILERQAGEYRGLGDIAAADRCQEAANAIKRDPREAARPEYGFLLSAAYMRLRHGDQQGASLTYMGAQPRGAEKAAFIRKAVEVLSRPN